MSFCPNCGNALGEADRYCARCGRALVSGLEGDAGSRPAGAASFLEPPLAAPPAARPPYRSARTRALVAMLAIGAVGFASILEVGQALSEIRLLRALDGIGLFSNEEVASSQNVASAVAVFYSVSFLSAVVAFLLWIHRAYSNVRSLGPGGLRFSPSWAVGWYFVPFMNLVRPYQVMGEIWRGSTRAAEGPAGMERGTSPLVGWWWGLWIAANFASGIVQQPTLTAAMDVENAVSVRMWAMGASTLLLVAAVLAMLVIRGVTSRQERGARALVVAAEGIALAAEAPAVQLQA